jgi:predicted thioesterase
MKTMKNPFQLGDQKHYEKIVLSEESATFESGTVHPVYATFALARDAEWACRLFVLEMKEEREEGIGTFINVRHKSPALIDAKVVFTATLNEVRKNNILCTFEAHVGDRLIAEGETGQKILKCEQFEKIFNGLK